MINLFIKTVIVYAFLSFFLYCDESHILQQNMLVELINIFFSGCQLGRLHILKIKKFKDDHHEFCLNLFRYHIK